MVIKTGIQVSQSSRIMHVYLSDLNLNSVFFFLYLRLVGCSSRQQTSLAVKRSAWFLMRCAVMPPCGHFRYYNAGLMTLTQRTSRM